MPEQRHLVLTHLRTATALATAMSFLLTQEAAYALPTGGQAAAGSATIASTGNTTTINQSSTRAILNWLGFDVGSGETVSFNQPSASAITLNRVTSGGASQIQGAINANGQVWIVNPQGVMFGAGSQVNVGGLLATASDIDDGRFMSGDYTFNHPGSATASISNAGHIKIADGGLAVLVGPNVSNSGVITATLGKVQLGSGNTFALDLYGDGLINLQAGPDITSQLIDNSGTIAADGGKVLLTTAAAENSINSLVNLDGIISAGDITIDGVAVNHTGTMHATGNVTITAKNIGQQGTITASNIAEDFTGAYIDNAASQTTANTISITGGAGSTLFASGGYTGSNISMAAENMWLYAATLDASGTSGGGSIFLGDSNTQNISVNFYSSLKADALDSGNGGHIKVWSNTSTTFGAATSARGGATSGNGGLIEISSAGQDYVGGNTPDVSAPHGTAGTFLLDPHNITIADTSTTGGGLAYFELTNPDPGSSGFGDTNNMIVLGNGNIVVNNPDDSFSASSSGAVYLFNGSTGALISTLRGSQANDRVGNGGDSINGSVALTGNNNFVIISPFWANGGNANAGAVTWGSGTTGVGGTVSSSNSLVGTNASDHVGAGELSFTVLPAFGGNTTTTYISGITVLTNGNYVVSSPLWNGGKGAVTWVNGGTGQTTNGVNTISSANSLVGSSAGDYVGAQADDRNSNPGIFSSFLEANPDSTALTNGNYVVISSAWANGATTQAGAVTWGNGTTGITGAVSSSNSLVGSQTNDEVGWGNATALSNGNYVVTSNQWANGAVTLAGAVTWGDGATGITGAVSSGNSLVGSHSNDQVGVGGIAALPNSNYVVNSYNWSNGVTLANGAVTWGDGTTGITGTISSSNSLIGSHANDQVGFGGITVLSNGNYIVDSYDWSNGTTSKVGAVTWGSGTAGVTGVVSSSNSLVGSHVNDQIGYNSYFSFYSITALSNGNYVVTSNGWDNGAIANAGAVTWGNGTTGTSGVVSSSNSLVGSTAGDQVGEGGIVPLTNGNYVVRSFDWSNGAVSKVGAATWGDGTMGITGTISSSNSLIGTQANDGVGEGITALTNGNYVVESWSWANGAATQAGATTWGDGTTGISGTVSSGNSLVGSQSSDQVGNGGVYALSNGNYVVDSWFWANGAVTQAGAVTWGNGTTGTTGTVSSSNSLVGSQANDEVGEGGVTILSSGNYVVESAFWANGAISDAGAVTFGSGTSGVTGAVSNANSILGVSAVANPGAIIEDTATGTFIAPFLGAGKIYVSPSDGINALSFNFLPKADFTVDTSYLASTLSAGTNVTLKANNDIILANDLTVTGSVGAVLSLDAGRSILINANITSASGIDLLTFNANEPLSAGVIDAQRDAGSAVITMSGGTSIDIGNGIVSMDLKTGSGLTNHDAGDITLRAISGSPILIHNDNSNGNIIADGQLSSVSTGTDVIVDAKGHFINNYGASLFSLPAGGYWRIYSHDSSGNTYNGLIAGFTVYSCVYLGSCGTIPGTGDGFLYAIASSGGSGGSSPLTSTQSLHFTSASQWISDLSSVITADPLNPATQRRDTTPPVLLDLAEAFFSPRYLATPYYIYNPYGDGSGLLHASFGCDGEGCPVNE